MQIELGEFMPKPISIILTSMLLLAALECGSILINFTFYIIGSVLSAVVCYYIFRNIGAIVTKPTRFIKELMEITSNMNNNYSNEMKLVLTMQAITIIVSVSVIILMALRDFYVI